MSGWYWEKREPGRYVVLTPRCDRSGGEVLASFRTQRDAERMVRAASYMVER